jgi:hypothetical protein
MGVLLQDPGAELVEENLAAVVRVYGVELGARLGLGELEVEVGEALAELSKVDAVDVARVDLVEHKEEAVEEHEVAEQRRELVELHPVVAVAVAQGRGLVGAHEGALLVEDGELLDLAVCGVWWVGGGN